MSAMLAVIQEKAQQLSPHRQSELIDFADFLLSKDELVAPVPLGEPAFDWVDEEGATPLPSSSRELAFDWVIDDDSLSEGLTSVEMQHQATQWMVEMAEKNLAQQ
jgi:Protein of unknown function (DUF2281)